MSHFLSHFHLLLVFKVSSVLQFCFFNLMLHLLSKIAQLTANPTAASIDLMLRQERANAFCEAIRALDATGLLN